MPFSTQAVEFPIKTYSFSTAKAKLKYFYTNVTDVPKTLYSNCNIIDWRVPKGSCIYLNNVTTISLDFEHVVPASRMKAMVRCSTLPREECARINPFYKMCHSNLHNLYPAISVINKTRSDIPFGIVNDNFEYLFGEYIGMKRSLNFRVIEPGSSVKGIIARATLYMESLGCVELSLKEQAMYHTWNVKHKPKPMELYRNYYIHSVIGASNPFITK